MKTVLPEPDGPQMKVLPRSPMMEGEVEGRAGRGLEHRNGRSPMVAVGWPEG